VNEQTSRRNFPVGTKRIPNVCWLFVLEKMLETGSLGSSGQTRGLYSLVQESNWPGISSRCVHAPFS
jgi:hypothetical protein